jgi:hypothetical protein
MAIFQSILNFFQPGQGRRTSVTGGPGSYDSATERALAAATEIIEGASPLGFVRESFQEDLKDAFDVKSLGRAGYEPGALGKLKYSTLDLITNPVESAWETLNDAFKMDLPATSYLWKDTSNQIWKKYFASPDIWVDPNTRESVIPKSLQSGVLRWNEVTGVRGLRELREKKAIKENPGLVLMMGRRLEAYYASAGSPPPSFGGKSIASIISEADKSRIKVEKALSSAENYSERAEAFAKKGDLKSADRFWKAADVAWREADSEQTIYAKESKSYRSELITGFDVLASKDRDFAATPEGSFWRYWKYRNKTYSALNLMKKYKKDGLGGVLKDYVYDEIVSKLFKEDTWREYLYPPNAIAKLQEETVAKFLQPVLTRINNFRVFVTRVWDTVIKEPIKNILVRIGGKLGLRALGAALGSAIPVAGTAVGAFLGAVTQLIAESFIKKVTVPLLKILGYAFVGVIGCFGLFIVVVVVLISTGLSNISYPWEKAPTDIDCNQSATATHQCVASKDAVEDIADGWGGNTNPGENHVEECYSDVIAKSNSYGVDPRLAMATWLHESNASNYEMYKRLGEPAQDFGIPAQKGNGFTAQINSFLGFYNGSKSRFKSCYTGKSNAEGFFRAFCTAGREALGVGQCPNLTAAGEKCVADFMQVYNWINSCQ